MTFAIDVYSDSIKEVSAKIVDIKPFYHFLDDTKVTGYHIYFQNDYVLSVQFGWGNYCDNYNVSIYDTSVDFTKTSNAEIAYWKGENGTMIYFEESGDTVLGYQTFEEVLSWMKKISEME